MSLRKFANFARLGASALVDLYQRGALGPRELWVAVKGAQRYLRAAADGDLAPDQHADFRATVCGLCPSMTLHDSDRPDVRVGYCGKALEPSEGPPPTCGCLTVLMLDGRPLPAGKAHVASEACPQGLWGPVRTS